MHVHGHPEPVVPRAVLNPRAGQPDLVVRARRGPMPTAPRGEARVSTSGARRGNLAWSLPVASLSDPLARPAETPRLPGSGGRLDWSRHQCLSPAGQGLSGWGQGPEYPCPGPLSPYQAPRLRPAKPVGLQRLWDIPFGGPFFQALSRGGSSLRAGALRLRSLRRTKQAPPT